MKAAYYEKQGKAHDVLMIGEIPQPLPNAGEVRVKVVVSGLNPADIKHRESFAGLPMAYPRVIPHQDGAGVIDAVGAGVPQSRIGQRVWIYEAQLGRAFGTAAQYVVIPQERAVPLPDKTSFEIGASLGIPAMTAYRCLFADGCIKGFKVLVQGGGGAVGTAAILLARWAGAWVAATVSNEKQAEIARHAGAQLVINRHQYDVAKTINEATEQAGVDRIVEVDAIANLDIDLACLALSGVISMYATDDPNAELRIPFLDTMFKGFVFRSVYAYSVPEAARLQAVLDINDCLNDDAYHPAIAKHFSLDEIASAHDALEQKAFVGKILVDIPA